MLLFVIFTFKNYVNFSEAKACWIFNGIRFDRRINGFLFLLCMFQILRRLYKYWIRLVYFYLQARWQHSWTYLHQLLHCKQPIKLCGQFEISCCCKFCCNIFTAFVLSNAVELMDWLLTFELSCISPCCLLLLKNLVVFLGKKILLKFVWKILLNAS